MSHRRLWTAASVFAALLVVPRVSSAGIGEFIWEMSGPQMFGVGLECKFLITGAVEQCYVTALKAKGDKSPTETRLRFSLEGGIYASTGKGDYRFGRVYMLTFDPMLELVTREKGDYAIYHGIMGATYNFLIGDGFRRFVNVGFKVRPIGVRYKRVNIEYNLRLYPNGFSAEQFGLPPDPAAGNKPEPVHGFSIGIALPKP